MCDHMEKSTDPSYHSTTYGIIRRSALNTLQYNHTCDLGLPPDIMHDLLEGYVPYKFKLMIKYFIEEKKLFSLEEFNARLSNFNYCTETKPTIIFSSSLSSSSNTELNQSGKSSGIIYIVTLQRKRHYRMMITF